MSVNKNILRFLPLLSAIIILGSCAGKYQDIRITSCDILSLNPKSLRSADAEISLGVNNPAGEITVSSFEAEVKNGSKPVCVLTSGPVIVEPRSEQVYKVHCNVSLPPELTVLEFLKQASAFDDDAFVIDVKAGVRINGGKEREMKFTGIKLTDIL